MNDLQQKLVILQQKRAEDKAKMKELEKFRLQYQQVLILSILACIKSILKCTELYGHTLKYTEIY